MLREIHIVESGLKTVRFTAKGSPPDLWPLITTAMNTNRTIAAVFMHAVLEYCRQENIDLVELERRTKLQMWVPPQG